MAKYFVTSSNTSGNEDGTTWAKAWSTIGRAITGTSYSGGTATGTTVALAAGDTLFVGSNHSETTTAGFTFAFPGTLTAPNYIYALNNETATNPGVADLASPATVSTTAQVNASGGSCFVTGSYYLYGIKFNVTSANVISFAPSATSANYRMIIESCFINIAQGGTYGTVFGSNNGAYSGETIVSNTGLRISVSTSRGVNVYSNTIFRNFYLVADGINNIPPGLFAVPTLARSLITFERCDFSNIPATKYLFETIAVNQGGNILLKDCNPPAGDLISALPPYAARISMVRSDGPASYKQYRVDDYQFGGKQTVDNTIYRTNGVTDGTNFYSWKIAQSVNAAIFSPYISAPISLWNTVTGSTVNVTLEALYVPASGATIPKNNQFWFDVQYLGSATGTQNLASGGVKNLLDTPVNLTASTAVWNAGLSVVPRSTAITVGSYYKYSSGGQVYYCTAAGTTGSSEPAVVADGSTVTDGTATLIACFRFKQTVALTAPTPAQVGDVYVMFRAAMASATLFVDPYIVLS